MPSYFLARYGCPLLICPKCNGTVVDHTLNEAAIHPFDEMFSKPSLSSFFSVSTVIDLIFLCLSTFLIVTNEYLDITLLAIALFAVIVLLVKIINFKRGGVTQKDFETYKEVYISSLDRFLSPKYVAVMKEYYQNISKDKALDIAKSLENFSFPKYLDDPGKVEKIKAAVSTCYYNNGMVHYHDTTKDELYDFSSNDTDLNCVNPKPSQQSTAVEKNDASNCNTLTKYCRYCGKKLPTDSLFCDSCGKKQ